MADISKIKTLNGTTYDIKDAKAVHNVYDGLDSSSTDDALSANMGKLLNSKITNIIEISASKIASDYPIGVFPIIWPLNITLNGVTPAGNMRGIAVNTGRLLHAFVSSANTAETYSIGLNYETYVVMKL